MAGYSKKKPAKKAAGKPEAKKASEKKGKDAPPFMKKKGKK